MTFTPVKALIKFSGMKTGLIVSFITTEHPWEPKYQSKNQQQDDPSRLSAVARQPFTLALRHLYCDMIGIEIRVAAFFRKNNNEHVCWCFVGEG